MLIDLSASNVWLRISRFVIDCKVSIFLGVKTGTVEGTKHKTICKLAPVRSGEVWGKAPAPDDFGTNPSKFCI